MVETPYIIPHVSPRVPDWVPVARPLPEVVGLPVPVPPSQNSQRLQLFAKELLMIPSGTVVSGNPAPKLKCDIFASIDWTNDGVIIRSELLDEEGYGGTFEAAWSDFLTSLRDRHASLAKKETRLSPADRNVLDGLRAAIDFSL